MKEAFISLFLAWSIQSSFCSWGHIVWRRILFDKYQDCCLVLGHPDILFILSLHIVWFLFKRTYVFEEIAWRIPRWLFNAWPSLISEWNDLSNSGSPFCLSFCSRGYMVWKKILFEVLKTAAMVAQHTDSACYESTIPSLMPYKLSHCTLQICRWFLEFWTVQKSNLTTFNLSNIYMAEPFYTYWYYTTQHHTKTLFWGEIIF